MPAVTVGTNCSGVSTSNNDYLRICFLSLSLFLSLTLSHSLTLSIYLSLSLSLALSFCNFVKSGRHISAQRVKLSIKHDTFLNSRQFIFERISEICIFLSYQHTPVVFSGGHKLRAKGHHWSFLFWNVFPCTFIHTVHTHTHTRVCVCVCVPGSLFTVLMKYTWYLYVSNGMSLTTTDVCLLNDHKHTLISPHQYFLYVGLKPNFFWKTPLWFGFSQNNGWMCSQDVCSLVHTNATHDQWRQ